MKTVIALHTGTGNSLYIAKQIPDAEIHFVEEFLSGGYALPDDTERLGIIFPIYSISDLEGSNGGSNIAPSKFP